MAAGVCAAVVGVLGLTSVAQAQVGAPAAATPSATVAGGVETAIRLTLPAGCTGPVKATGFPTPNGSTTSLQQVNSGTTAAPIVKVAGVWPPSSQVFALTITCANSKTGKENVTDESAPAPADVIGLGSDTTQNVIDQFSADYNATHKTSGTQLYYFDATNPITGAMGDSIQTKSGSSNCNIPRPDGASAGILALEGTKMTGSSPCIDFAGNTRARGHRPDLDQLHHAGR
jgi:hypothetical protein